MSPFSFTDEELDAVMALASALPPPSRNTFLEQVAGKLAPYPPQARGPGLLHRVAREAQAGFLGIAIGAGGKSVSGKYGR